MGKMMELVKRKDWQDLRESLLGKWKSEPEKCCQKLKSFLGSIKTTEEDKLRIVMNYLTSSAFRHGVIKHPCTFKLRAMISVELKKRKFSDKD